ncbi:oligopeptide transport system ATP-binding protein [Micromonospora rhizosphaerae]|uniref:Oligopeptide transport system ATP-binding protein n=1 Tax=Micromonospora rhizosphaerae TaxID=568872 RepID=A0A1C6T3N7_9ACTN|nr:ABC transporter ATP-binding protein [Micromonospora rhizosphaerae]SCL36440.1 oligopeptide transport system ATP-binding protein [Micromonospora rhizosphaerae]
MSLLEVQDLHTEFRTRHGVVRAVDGVTFSVEPGETLALVGESGCGKSATAMSIIGLLPGGTRGRVVQGTIQFEGRDLRSLSERQMEDVRGRDIGTIFQDPSTSLNPSFTIGSHLVEALRRHSSLTKVQARTRAVELLSEVRIPDPARRLDGYPHQLSGGMRQRVMIALALACGPRLLIADEPTTALDVTIQAEILALLARIREERRMSMLLITHDMGVAALTADRVAVMYAGQIVEHAAVSEVFAHPEHPYTEALMAAMPTVGGTNVRHGRLSAIGGAPPNLIDPPTHCRFADRCPHTREADGCTTSMPQLQELRPGHWVRSFHAATERMREGSHAQ